MAQGDFNIDTAGVEISKVRTVGDVRRPQLLSQNRYNQGGNEYNKTNADIYSEGIGGDNRGKEPSTPPISILDAYQTVGSKDDISARISNTSPGSLTKNTYRAGQREYDNVI